MGRIIYEQDVAIQLRIKHKLEPRAWYLIPPAQSICRSRIRMYLFRFKNFFFPPLGEEVRAEHFMDELDNGVKLCRLAELLQSKIPKECLMDKSRVSRAQSATLH